MAANLTCIFLFFCLYATSCWCRNLHPPFNHLNDFDLRAQKSLRSRSIQIESRDVMNETGLSSISNNLNEHKLVELEQGSYSSKNAKGSCSENYGFLPCSTSIFGNVFLLIVYGFFLFKGAQLLSDGSEMLLTVLNPGIIGGLVLPVLGSLPDTLLILVSGVSASKQEAQSEILVGMGVVAGSTVMLLTLLWGTCLIVGRCDLYVVQGRQQAKENTLQRGFDLFGTGVTTDAETRVGSWIMMATILPYVLAQVPKMFGWSSKGRLFVILACVLAFFGLVSYCAYQVASPWIQQRRIELAKERYRRISSLHKVSRFSQQQNWGALIENGGSINKGVLRKIFDCFDKDKDCHLSEEELRGLIIGIGLQQMKYFPEEEILNNWMAEFDEDVRDHKISWEEFQQGVDHWVKGFNYQESGGGEMEPGDLSHAATRAEESFLTSFLPTKGDEDEDGEEGARSQRSRKLLIWQACLKIMLGTVLAAIFADPLVDAMQGFSDASGIPSFFVSFIASPLATNSSEAVSSLVFASRKRRRNLCLTYSQVYGAVTLNNTLCLGVFLAIVASRGLTWDFSSEILVIVVVTLAIGLLAGFRITFPLWTALVALFLYPFSIALVAVLDYVAGWQ